METIAMSERRLLLSMAHSSSLLQEKPHKRKQDLLERLFIKGRIWFKVKVKVKVKATRTTAAM